jgi:hypothetical protein
MHALYALSICARSEYQLSKLGVGVRATRFPEDLFVGLGQMLGTQAGQNLAGMRFEPVQEPRLLNGPKATLIITRSRLLGILT